MATRIEEEEAAPNEQAKLTSATNEIKPTSQDRKMTKSEVLKWIMEYFVSVLIGFTFGYVMEKSKVHEPKSIRQQMIFQKFIMFKMFLSALATSVLSILFASLLFKTKYEKILQSGRDALKNKNVLILFSGGLLIGAGMQISGACPGMVLVQLGAGVPWSYITLIGAFGGALVHGLLNEYLIGSAKPDSCVSKTLFDAFRINPIITRILMIILFGSVVFILEFFFPWTSEYINPIENNSYNIFVYRAWPPYACGIILGSLQFLSLLLLGKSLGASTFFTTIIGVPFFTKSCQQRFPYLAKFRSGLHNWLALAFTVGAILGGFASSYPSGVFAKADGVHPYDAFYGGFLMVFGARLAGGCTSGHGISGSSHQLIGSLLTTCGIFVGAISQAFYALTNSFFL